mmetsp:Transcript_24956/g.71672  ORF Transcript_24956/g.71672 Transcript_24956/m.71672 type:complete len:768 (+) Transcript_24956:91-2394(+)
MPTPVALMAAAAAPAGGKHVLQPAVAGMRQQQPQHPVLTTAPSGHTRPPPTPATGTTYVRAPSPSTPAPFGASPLESPRGRERTPSGKHHVPPMMLPMSPQLSASAQRTNSFPPQQLFAPNSLSGTAPAGDMLKNSAQRLVVRHSTPGLGHSGSMPVHVNVVGQQQQHQQHAQLQQQPGHRSLQLPMHQQQQKGQQVPHLPLQQLQQLQHASVQQPQGPTTPHTRQAQVLREPSATLPLVMHPSPLQRTRLPSPSPLQIAAGFGAQQPHSASSSTAAPPGYGSRLSSSSSAPASAAAPSGGVAVPVVAKQAVTAEPQQEAQGAEGDQQPVPTQAEMLTMVYEHVMSLVPHKAESEKGSEQSQEERLKTRCQELEDQVRKLNSRAEAADTLAEEREGRIRTLEAEMRSAEIEASEKRGTVDSDMRKLEEKVQHAEDRRREAESQLEQERKQVESFRAQVQLLQNQAADREQSLQLEASAKDQDWKAQVAQAQKMRDEAVAECVQLRARERELSERLGAASEATRCREDETRALMTQLERSEGERGALSKELERSEGERLSLEARLRSMKDRLKDERQALQAKFDSAQKQSALASQAAQEQAADRIRELERSAQDLQRKVQDLSNSRDALLIELRDERASADGMRVSLEATRRMAQCLQDQQKEAEVESVDPDYVQQLERQQKAMGRAIQEQRQTIWRLEAQMRSDHAMAHLSPGDFFRLTQDDTNIYSEAAGLRRLLAETQAKLAESQRKLASRDGKHISKKGQDDLA